MVIRSCNKTYAVHIHKSDSFIREILDKAYSFFVVDKYVFEIYKDSALAGLPENNLFLIEAKEENKVIDTALEICERMTDIEAKRNATLVSIGGGIIQDITGFAANILYRGIHWVFIPTTLLSACDSCIGGKTSLNYKRYKNLLGTFYAPDEIHIYPGFFSTLSDKDYKSGLGEVAKFNIMRGSSWLNEIALSLDMLLSRDGNTVEKYLMSSLEYKKSIIEEDEFDRGVRINLNYAHTFGHAFETVSNYDIPHGTAVAMGAIAANRISLVRGYMGPDYVEHAEYILKQIIPNSLFDVSESIPEIIEAMKKDKKRKGTAITTVLLRLKENNVEPEVTYDTTEDEVKEAVEYTMGLLKEHMR